MIPGSANPLLLAGAAEAGAYSISRSVRLNSADSAYLSRTPASAGNRKTWTMAFWVKRSVISTYQLFFSAGNDASNNRTDRARFSFESTDTLNLGFGGGGSSFGAIFSGVLFRDPSAWYHLVIRVDTNEASISSAFKLYVNGVQSVSASDSGNTSYSSFDTPINNNVAHEIGRQLNGTNYLNAYIGDFHLIDGQALDPTSFGEFDDNGIWQPKAYTGSYGTNGFHLDFSDNSTAAALGTDTSGNSNTWTVNNISVAAGAGNDSLVDVPTNGTETDTGVGSEVRGNYCTLNPLFNAGSVTYANGNLDASGNNQNGQSIGTIAPSSGKWYYEVTLTGLSSTDPLFGISKVDALSGSYPGAASTSYSAYNFTGNTYIYKVNNGSFTATNTTVAVQGDVIGVAFDLDNGKFWVSKNNTWVDSGNPAAGTNALFSSLSGSFVPAIRVGGSNTGSCTLSCNFGQRPFAYTAPSGFKALCTANLDAPVVTKPSEYMDIALYTGNGTSQTISGLEFSPDFVWVKDRTTANSHQLGDTVRGNDKVLFSNSTIAEVSGQGRITGFTSDGFSVGTNIDANKSGDAYVAWTWDAGSSTVSNTDGSITSSVRANPSAGFSIVGYTGTGSLATVGHGLGVAPEMIIFKNRDRVEAWPVYHAETGATHWMRLDGANAATASATFLNNTAPTSSVITINTWVALNGNNEEIIAYCFAPVEGYSVFGSYVGNGSSDGPFVYTGFRPKWLLIKNSSNGGNWNLFDTSRSTYNATGELLLPNLSNSEYSQPPYNDFLSNGFKLRTNDSGKTGLNTNQSGQSYVFAAFAEAPFQYARAR